MRLSTFLSLSLSLSLASPLALGAATIQVNSFANASVDDGNCTLSEAIAAAISDSAQDACTAGSGADEIVLLNPGTYPGTNAPFLSGAQTVTIRGDRAAGGRDSFVIDLGFLDRFLTVQNGADVTIENLTIWRGEPHFENGGCLVARQANLTVRDVYFTGCVSPRGGALYWNGNGTNRLVVERTTFQANAARFVVGGSGQMLGGAVAMEVAGTASARFTDVEFLDNEADCLGANCNSGFGGAFHGFFFDQSTLTFTRTVFINNRLRFDDTDVGSGGAATIQAGAGPVVLEDGFFSGNTIESTGTVGGASALQGDFGGPTRLDRLRFLGNDQAQPNRVQVDVRSSVTAVVELTNVLIAKGPAQGLFLQSNQTSSIVAGNLTVTNHGTRGIAAFQAQVGSSIRIDNSIVWQNGTDTIENFGTTPTIDPSNFIGSDPHFVNPALNDYELAFTSPARDNGNGTLASVGPYDALHRVRIVGPAIDRGAFERNALWSDGFESGDAGAWTLAVP